LGFLEMFQGSPIRRLEKDAESNPSPDSLTVLAQKYLEMGEMDRAVEVAEKGIGLFRDASRLRDIVAFVRKKRSQEEIKRLRDELKVRPGPAAYAQLARLYRDLKDVDLALELLAECVERFSQDPVAYLMMAEIRLDNFFREMIAFDGLHALRALRRVREIDPQNSPGRIHLAQLYYAVGANGLCATLLREELAAFPMGLDLKEFVENLGAPAELEADRTVESLLEHAEDAGALPNSLEGFPRFRGIWRPQPPPPRVNASALHEQAKSAADKSPGLRNLLVLALKQEERTADAGGKTPGAGEKKAGGREMVPVASCKGDGALEPEAFRALVSEVLAVASDSARRMDIGSFTRGGVQFPEGGGLAIHRSRGLCFAVLYRDPLKRDRAEAIAANLAGKAVGAGGTRA